MKIRYLFIIIIFIVFIVGCSKNEKQKKDDIEQIMNIESKNTCFELVKENMYVSNQEMNFRYKQFLSGEVEVPSPFNEEEVLSIYDDEYYRKYAKYNFPIELIKKEYALLDINGDNKEELIFRIEAGSDQFLYILGCLNNELVGYDIYETHTSHMSFDIYDNGIVEWGQNHTGQEKIYYRYNKNGKAEEIIHFICTSEKWEEVYLEENAYNYYEYYYLNGDESTRVYLTSTEEYKEIVSKIQGNLLEWDNLEEFNINE